MTSDSLNHCHEEGVLCSFLIDGQGIIIFSYYLNERFLDVISVAAVPEPAFPDDSRGDYRDYLQQIKVNGSASTVKSS